MRTSRRSPVLAALALLLCALALGGCAAGEEAVVDSGQLPAEKAGEVVAHVEEEGGEGAAEEMKERRAEYEAAQEEREEQQGEAGEQAQAEGAEVRDAVQQHEEEQESAEEGEEKLEHELRPGRALREY